MNIIARFATCSCPTKRNPTTVRTVDFAVSVEQKISDIAMIAECALTRAFTQITIAKAENTSPIAPFAKSSYLVPEVPPMKCPVVMPFTGNVSDNWLHMIPDAPFARKLRKPVNE